MDAGWFHFENKKYRNQTQNARHTCAHPKMMRYYKPLGLVRKPKIGQ